MLYVYQFFLVAFGMMAGTLAIAQEDTTGATRGSDVYETSCASCHSGGFGGFFTGAPKVGKQSDWVPLLAKGMDSLVASTITGIGKMAARGGCAACSDDQIKAAVEYMVEQSR